MRPTAQQIRSRRNWILPVLYLAITSIGLVAGFSSSYNKLEGGVAIEDMVFFLKDSIPVGIGILLFFGINLVPSKYWHITSFPLYAAGIISLVLVLLIGVEINGAKSWVKIPGLFNFQVAEFAKMTTGLGLAAFLSYYKSDLNRFQNQLIALGIIGLPFVLTILQPDAGTGLIFISLAFVLFLAGYPPLLFIVGLLLLTLFIVSQSWSLIGSATLALLLANAFLIFQSEKIKRKSRVVLALIFLSSTLIIIFSAEESLYLNLVVILGLLVFYITNKHYQPMIQTIVGTVFLLSVTGTGNYIMQNVLEPHQKERIDVWLNPATTDSQGAGYNLSQSKMAIGSGGFSGKGFLKGTLTRLDRVPEQRTDFIFSVLGEEQGFLGCASLIILFGILLYRISVVSGRFKSDFNRYFAYAVLVMFVFHVLINIGMTMGLMPIVGIPLPFVSKGGSSFIMFSVMLGIVHSMQYRRDA